MAREANAASSVKRAVQEKGEELSERLDELHDKVDEKLEHLKEMKNHVRDEIKHRPLTYVAIAFGAGLVLGLLARRRN